MVRGGIVKGLRAVDASENQDEEVLSRVIAYEDVSQFLFSLSSERARFCLVSQFIDHFDGPMPLWCSTNSSSWTGKILGLEVLPKSVLEELQNVVRLVDQNENNSGDSSLGFFLKIFDETSKRSNILKFIQNAALLCVKAFPRNHLLQEVILKSDSLFDASMSSDASVTPTRALAKSLLKGDRQDLLLCGVYARTEAAFGCVDASRKVFDMALASIDGLSADLQVNACLLYFWYAEMELSNAISGRNPESSKQRAVHILSCLGCGVKYIAFTGQTSSMLSLRVRQGFKEKIKVLRSSWAHGDIKEHSVALICAAALFESLTSGWPSAAAVFEEAFSMVLPGRRSQSHLLESLYLYYIVVLKRHLEQEKLSRSWRTILQGLDLYPYNPKVFSAFIEVGFLFSVSYKIRRSLDDSFKSKPSVIAWLFSFVYELGKTCSRHRIHALFERALQKSELQRSVLLWRSYLAYELINGDCTAAKRVFFRAIHACPWSKILWLDGFEKLSTSLTAKELGDLQEVMRDKELNLRTDIYEILLQDEPGS